MIKSSTKSVKFFTYVLNQVVEKDMKDSKNSNYKINVILGALDFPGYKDRLIILQILWLICPSLRFK